jgi:hypothetical protein
MSSIETKPVLSEDATNAQDNIKDIRISAAEQIRRKVGKFVSNLTPFTTPVIVHPEKATHFSEAEGKWTTSTEYNPVTNDLEWVERGYTYRDNKLVAINVYNTTFIDWWNWGDTVIEKIDQLQSQNSHK